MPSRDQVRVRRVDALRARLDLYGPRPDPTTAPGPDPCGDPDTVVPPAHALEYGRLLTNSRTVIFAETGHVPMAERPVRFNHLLRRVP